jgi:hypothetical protein
LRSIGLEDLGGNADLQRINHAKAQKPETTSCCINKEQCIEVVELLLPSHGGAGQLRNRLTVPSPWTS